MMRTLPKRGLAGFAFAGVALLAVACDSGSSSPTEPAASPVEIEQASLSLVNSSRSGSGVVPVNLSPAATAVARGHSAAMRDFGFFGHSDPQGRTLAERLDDAGIPHSAAAENLGMVTGAADPAGWIHNELMSSPEHRQHILDEGFELAGVGVAVDGATVWITQVFIRP